MAECTQTLTFLPPWPWLGAEPSGFLESEVENEVAHTQTQTHRHTHTHTDTDTHTHTHRHTHTQTHTDTHTHNRNVLQTTCRREKQLLKAKDDINAADSAWWRNMTQLKAQLTFLSICRSCSNCLKTFLACVSHSACTWINTSQCYKMVVEINVKGSEGGGGYPSWQKNVHNLPGVFEATATHLLGLQEED